MWYKLMNLNHIKFSHHILKSIECRENKPKIQNNQPKDIETKLFIQCAIIDKLCAIFMKIGIVNEK